MSEIFKNLQDFRQKNNLPKKLVVDIDGYGLYNTSIGYGILCLHDKKYINTYSKIDFRKLINNDRGVVDNISKIVESSLTEIRRQLPVGSFLIGKHMAIIMGMSGQKYSVCCIHKFIDQDSLLFEFEYIFKSIVKKYKETLHT